MNYFKIYTLSGLIHLIINTLRTRLFYSPARLIRFPADFRGIRNIRYGKGFTTGIGCRLEAYPVDNDSVSVCIGENVQINDYVHITGIKMVSIGNNVLIASKVYISDSSHGSYVGNDKDSDPESIPKERKLSFKEVYIEDNVWIGESVTVLPGVTIGKGSIIGANSVVTKSIPENVIAVGNPVRVIKKFNKENSRWEMIK
jgi:acetyltransferase-like isoleucine patch superfamily enzyme